MFRNKFSRIGLAAFFIVLLSMPLGHAAMILVKHYFEGSLPESDGILIGCCGAGTYCLRNAPKE